MASEFNSTALPHNPATRPEVYLPWRNPDNVITLETFFLIEKGLSCYFIPIMFFIGMPANVLNCIVFVRQGLRDRMNLCLFSLSLMDLMYVCLFTLPGIQCWVGLVWPDDVEWWKTYSNQILLGPYRGFLLCSGCLTMIISVERCVCVFLPLKAASLMKTRTMAILIAGTIVVIHLLCLIFPFKLGVDFVTDPFTNHSEYQVVITDTYHQNMKLFDVIEHTILTNGIPLVSLVVVAISTSITIVQLKRMMAWRENVSMAKNASTSQQIALVKMLVIICCIFITTSSPFVALSITTLIEPEFFFYSRYHNIFMASHDLHQGLSMINCSLNFFVYLLRSSKFRQELRALFRLCLCVCDKNRNKNTDVVTQS